MPRFTVPGSTVSLLTATSKMPSKSWSLPAIMACPGAFFGPGAICGESKDHTLCYATRSSYGWAVVKNAQQARYQWLLFALSSDDTFTLAVDVFVKAIKAEKKDVFRVHDSGDLFNRRYIDLWIRVCSSLPTIRFWFPTRSWRIPNLLPKLRELHALPNVTVRPSALRFGDAPPVVEGLGAGTSASKTDYNCPAHSQDNQCLDCRKCWDKNSEVVYRAH